MNKEKIINFAAITQPFTDVPSFIEDIKKPLEYHFRKGRGINPGRTANCLKKGIELIVEFPIMPDFPETAFVSLRRVLVAKDIKEVNGTYPVYFRFDKNMQQEEFSLIVNAKKTILASSDVDGLRRGIYFLEDRICESEGKSITEGMWQRKPFVKHRVSRCFFGPTNRPPFFIDELNNDDTVDGK